MIFTATHWIPPTQSSLMPWLPTGPHLGPCENVGKVHQTQLFIMVYHGLSWSNVVYHGLQCISHDFFHDWPQKFAHLQDTGVAPASLVQDVSTQRPSGGSPMSSKSSTGGCETVGLLGSSGLIFLDWWSIVEIFIWWWSGWYGEIWMSSPCFFWWYIFDGDSCYIDVYGGLSEDWVLQSL